MIEENDLKTQNIPRFNITIDNSKLKESFDAFQQALIQIICKMRLDAHLFNEAFIEAQLSRTHPLGSILKKCIERESNPNCKFNAHSLFIKCAVNPTGECKNCHHFEPKN